MKMDFEIILTSKLPNNLIFCSQEAIFERVISEKSKFWCPHFWPLSYERPKPKTSLTHHQISPFISVSTPNIPVLYLTKMFNLVSSDHSTFVQSSFKSVVPKLGAGGPSCVCWFSFLTQYPIMTWRKQDFRNFSKFIKKEKLKYHIDIQHSDPLLST